MAIDLNMDLGDIIKALKNKSKPGTATQPTGKMGQFMVKIAPFQNIIIFSFVMLIIIGAYTKLMLMPLMDANDKKATELSIIINKKNELPQLDQKITSIKSNLDESKEKYLESLSQFGNSEDLGELYQSISKLASKYNLIVLNIKEIERPPAPLVMQEDGTMISPDDLVDPNKPKVKEVIVDVELKGSYGEYIKFKEDMSIAEMLLKINTEKVSVKNSKTEQGIIYVELNISTYAIDKTPFREVIDEGLNDNIEGNS